MITPINACNPVAESVAKTYLGAAEENVCCTEQNIASIIETKSYVTIATCVLEHILCTRNLTSDEKRFWLLCDFISNIGLNSPKGSGERQLRFSIAALATMLGISKRTVLRFQKTLVEKGYLVVEKGGIDKRNRRKRNLLTPILPESVFRRLNAEPNKTVATANELNGSNENIWSHRELLDTTKLFVKINFNMLRLVLANAKLNTVAKLLWIYCYIRSYISEKQDGSSIFTATVAELIAKLAFSGNAIRGALQQLSANYFVSYKESKRDSDDSYRREQRILALSALLPRNIMETLQSTPNRRSYFLDHHQTHNCHHQTSSMSPLCIKHNNKHLNIKHDGAGEPIDITNATAPTFPTEVASNVINKTSISTSIAIETSTGTKNPEPIGSTNAAQKIVEKILDFKGKCEQAGVDEETTLEMYNSRLSEADKDLLTTEAVEVNEVVEQQLDAIEQETAPKQQTFEEFISSFLLPYELFLYLEFLKKYSKILKKSHWSQLPTKTSKTSQQGTHSKDFIKEMHAANCKALGANGVKHIENYISKLFKNGDIRGDAQHKSLERLVIEVVLFAISWKPTKAFTGARDKRCFQLAVAGNKLRTGVWTTPPAYLAADRAQIDCNIKAATQH